MLALAMLSVAPAKAGWLELCNRGNVDLSLAVAEGFIGMFSSVRQHVSGFVSLPAGRCFERHNGAGTAWALAFVARDTRGRQVPVQFDFGAPTRRWAADAICGPDLVPPPGAFSYSAWTSMNGLGQNCTGGTPLAYPVSGTFIFGDNNATVTVRPQRANIDRLAAAYHAGRDPEADRARAAAEAERQRREIEAAAKFAQDLAAAAERRRLEEEARRRREAEAREARRLAREAREAENAASDTPQIEVQFGASLCHDGPWKNFVFHLLIPQSDGSFATHRIKHHARPITSSRHSETFAVPRQADGTLELYWYAEAATRSEQRVIWGDIPVTVGDRGQLMLHQERLEPNRLERLTVVCASNNSGPYSQAVRKRFGTVLTEWQFSEENADPMRAFASAIVEAGVEEEVYANRILALLVERRFDPLTGSKRAEILNRLSPGLAEDDQVVLLSAPLPFYRDLDLYYALRVSAENPLRRAVIASRPGDGELVFLPLDGTNEPLYRASVHSRDTGGLLLNEANAKAYLTAFMTIVEGQAGRFTPISSSEVFDSGVPWRTRKRVDELIAECASEGAVFDGTAFQTSRAFLFGTVLGCTDVRVEPTGLVSMSNERVLLSDLPSYAPRVELD